MAITAEQLDKVRLGLDDAVKLEDLKRRDWRRQTDVVQQAFIVTRLFADHPTGRVIFVDAHINDAVKGKALEHPSGIKHFFNRRFHDAGLKSRKIVVFDTVTTKAMGKRGNSIARLHFHGAFELSEGQNKVDLEKKLERVFGRAHTMGQRQFHFTNPDWKKFSSHKGVQAHGPLGKILYAIKHAGSAYRVLGLNEDRKRSRKAPAHRGANNKQSLRLAKGDPANFNKAVVLCDTRSKQAGEEAFKAWLAAELRKANPETTAPERVEPLRSSAAA